MKLLKHIAFITLAVLGWTAFIAFGFIDGFLLRAITSQTTSEAFIEAVKGKINQEFVGNFAMTLIENGKIDKHFFHSTDQPVTENTIFPVASISKWVTSFGVMKLVEEGKLDLDRPIDDYLTRWHLPESEFDNRKVTVRKLLSHSAGLVDGLGYGGFAPDEKVQTIEESLTKAADSPYSEGIARVGYAPGSAYMYSGASYTLLQLLIEELTGQSFQDYMTETIFEPLKMDNSTFVLAEKPAAQVAQLYDDEGKITPVNKFTALAAASLFTSTADLSKFMLSNISENQVLSKRTLSEMSKPETFINQVGIYGLGPHLYSQNDPNSNVIGHDGSGARIVINTTARIDLSSKNGLIILEIGSRDLASILADEWLFWKVGIADYVVMHRNKPYILTLLIVGYLIIILVAVLIIRKKTKSAVRSATTKP